MNAIETTEQLERVTQSMDPVDDNQWYWHIEQERPYKLAAYSVRGETVVLQGDDGKCFLATKDEVVHIKSQIFLAL